MTPDPHPAPAAGGPAPADADRATRPAATPAGPPAPDPARDPARPVPDPVRGAARPSSDAVRDPARPSPDPVRDPARSAARREMGVVAGAWAAGGGLALFAAGRPWVELVAGRRPPFGDVVVSVSGRSLEPLVPGLGLVGLAGVVGLLAARRWGRLAVAALVTLAGLGIAATALTRLGTPGAGEIRDLFEDSGRAGSTAGATLSATASPGWPLLAAAGGLLLAAGGVLALLRSRAWPAMSARYETPAARREVARPRTDAALWDALDSGDDPTTADPPDPADRARAPGPDPGRPGPGRPG